MVFLGGQPVCMQGGRPLPSPNQQSQISN
jgi:hypothetical protein